MVYAVATLLLLGAFAYSLFVIAGMTYLYWDKMMAALRGLSLEGYAPAPRPTPARQPIGARAMPAPALARSITAPVGSLRLAA